MFSCEYWEIFKNTYFEEHLHTAASEVTLGSEGGFQNNLFIINGYHKKQTLVVPGLHAQNKRQMQPREPTINNGKFVPII